MSDEAIAPRDKPLNPHVPKTVEQALLLVEKLRTDKVRMQQIRVSTEQQICSICEQREIRTIKLLGTMTETYANLEKFVLANSAELPQEVFEALETYAHLRPPRV